MRQLLHCVLILVFATAGGCNGYVAQKFVGAPNEKLSARGVDAPPEVLAEHHIAEQLRVEVGPPPASISVWVVDSIMGPAYLSLTPGPTPRDDPVAKLTVLPSTRPAEQAQRPAKGTVFILHGLEDSKEDVIYQFYSYGIACQGYRVVLVDLRGHGRSTGDHISYGAYEAHDMVQVLDELQRQNLIAGKVGVLGLSYGAAVGICWASIDPRVRVVVALEPFSSLRYAARDAGRTMLMAFKWAFDDKDYTDIANRIDRILGINSDRASPLYAMAHMKTPVLLIHGKADDFLYPIHSIRLHEAGPDHSQLILVDGADHFDLWYRAARMIMAECREWFGRYLSNDGL